jgi:dihydrofolate synthase/folylpolyglutamate synthase
MRKQGFDIPDKAVKSGMKKTFNPGRFEVILKDPYIILDGAHNEAGVTSLTETLLSEFSGKKILLCTGILADKEFDKMAAELSRLNADVITTSVPNPRTMDAEPLGEVFRKYAQDGIKITVKDKWEEAVKYASEISKDYDVTVWAGSLYLIGAVRGCLI